MNSLSYLPFCQINIRLTIKNIMKFLSTLIFLGFCINSAFTQPEFAATIEGPLLIEDTPGHVIMKAADGSYWTLMVDPSGELRTFAATFQNLEITLSNIEVYKLRLSVGDEEGVGIFKQAEHFYQSTIVMDASTNWEHEYQYIPDSNYAGQDQVTILLSTGSDGASPNTNFEYLTIKFTIHD